MSSWAGGPGRYPRLSPRRDREHERGGRRQEAVEKHLRCWHARGAGGEHRALTRRALMHRRTPHASEDTVEGSRAAIRVVIGGGPSSPDRRLRGGGRRMLGRQDAVLWTGKIDPSAGREGVVPRPVRGGADDDPPGRGLRALVRSHRPARCSGATPHRSSGWRDRQQVSVRQARGG
jgi:hypothetical protein